MAIDPAAASAVEIASAVCAGKISAAAVIDSALAAIRMRDRALNSFTAVTEDRARARAQTIDEVRAKGDPLGPLAGVPFAVKNLFDVAGLQRSPARRSIANARRPRATQA